MEPLAVTLNPLESTTLCTINESLNQTTWSSEQVTEPPFDREREDYHVFESISLFICVLGMIGNALLTLFLIFCVKKKPFIVYVLHLSIADFMVLLCSSILHLVNIFHFYDDTLLSYIIFLIMFGYNTGLYLLTAISVERCLSVLYPIWYQCQRPKHQSAVACIVLWALSVLVSGLENFFCLDRPRYLECRYVYLFSCIMTFLIFVPLMVFSNLLLFIRICCHSQRRQPAKLYIIILATVALFLVFAMPMKVLLILIHYSNLEDMAMWQFIPYLYLLSTVNCSVNPIVYFVVGSLRRKKRKSLREALQKVFEEKPVAGPSKNQLSPTSMSFPLGHL
ncbi:Mas-related G-protein coupled receptor member H [Heterocephalus glaber]|uniref:Mas-related G-protein coupled receptor member H n=1 Tax=Heterocephalus glaber TaxID=10181 RepID=G5BC61_HETGA|nr:mas-related G-protein coupled receptor member H [Heterocephalus glaber]EHB06872.1 Mas-related G-protein coupled receptor member H [Heterocephalus glaber]